MTASTKYDLSAVLRGTAIEGSRAGVVLSLMLLWSQLPTSKLKGLPSFEDASAEFMFNELPRVTQVLRPKGTDEVSHTWEGQWAGELETLRRVVLDSLHLGVTPDEIAEAILEYCAPDAWASRESVETLVAALGPQEGARIRCGFYHSMRVAWSLSKHATIDLDVDLPEFAVVISNLADACDRSLNARVNRIDSIGSITDGAGTYDHAVILPPLGLRFRIRIPSQRHFAEGTLADQLGAEEVAAMWGAHLGRRGSIVVVSDGLLFRTTSTNAAFKELLIRKHRLEAVISLPRGTMARSMAALSALVFSGQDASDRQKDSLRFIDASDPSALDLVMLRALVAGDGEHPRCIDCSFREVSEAGFNLSVNRYVLDEEAWRTREFLKRQYTVRLSDIAEIRKPQALPRNSGSEPGVEVHEALLADIDTGRLNLPVKRSFLAPAARVKISSIVLEPGDILISVKGTIGKVALVTQDLFAVGNQPLIVPGQSFVIVRLRKGGLIREPEVLVSYLRSPMAQSLLQRMAGGTTIVHVAMGQLKEMPVTVPSAEVQAKIAAAFAEWQGMAKGIDILREKMGKIEESMARLSLGGST